MNIFHRITLQSLRQNRMRTVVTVVGIILSTAMICAVTTFASSLQKYSLENEIYRCGAWYGCAIEADKAAYDRMMSHEHMENAVYAEYVGFGILDGSKGKPYLWIRGTSDGAEEMLSLRMVKGRYPLSENEIALPNYLESDSGVKYGIGDKITLTLGKRIYEGQELFNHNVSPGNINGAFFDEENGIVSMPETENVNEFVPVQTKEYIVTGLYDGYPYGGVGYDCFTRADGVTEGKVYDVYYTTKYPWQYEDFGKECGIAGTTNSGVLQYQGVFSNSNFSRGIIEICAVVIVLIMFGSVSLIYNAFSVSVSERTKQFGLLSSLGATKKQLRKTVIFEALAVSAIGVPIGIVSGIGGIGVTFLFLGDKLDLYSSGVSMHLAVSAISVVFAVVISVVTVLISAYIPSRRAARSSAIDAVRQSKDIKTGKRTEKTSRLTYKLFGLPGVIASKHYKRNKKKYRTTVMSLFLSVVLFISASAFTDYLTAELDSGQIRNYDLSWYDTKGISELTDHEIIEILRSEEHITDAVGVKTSYLMYSSSIYIDEKYMTKEAFEKHGSDGLGISIHLSFISDSGFEELLKEYRLPKEKFIDTNAPLAIVVDGDPFYDKQLNKYSFEKIFSGDECQVSIDAAKKIDGYEYFKTDEGYLWYRSINDHNDVVKYTEEEAKTSVTLNGGKIISKLPYYINKGSSNFPIPTFIYPISLYDSVIASDVEDYSSKEIFRYYMRSTDHSASCEGLESILEENGLPGGVYDYAEDELQGKNMIFMIKVFAYGFTLLLSAIAAANVFNTVSTTVILRRREFAMLRSVGMTDKGFNIMMCYECILYGSKALLYGLPVSAIITYLISLSINSIYTAKFRPQWTASAIATISVFAVVFVTMIYSMKKLRKENTVDALKNENI